MPHFIKSFEIKPRDFIRAGEVSLQVQGVLRAIGFEPDIIRRASVCAYESEMNVVMYGGAGSLFLIVDPDNVTIEVKDDGPGIEDIELALQEGYTTSSPEYREIGFGAGMGLPNIKKNADKFEIYSNKGEGTRLKICIQVDDT